MSRLSIEPPTNTLLRLDDRSSIIMSITVHSRYLLLLLLLTRGWVLACICPYFIIKPQYQSGRQQMLHTDWLLAVRDTNASSSDEKLFPMIPA